MADHGAVATASFLDCGLPSTVGLGDLAPVAKAIISKLNESAPDLVVIELGDGILGGYSVESVFDDEELRAARSEEHTSELQSRQYLVCRLLLEKKKNTYSLASAYIT